MNIALSIGNFDAVHLGHIAIVEAARKVAGEGLVVIWSFNPSPTAFLHPEMEVERLTEFPHRRALLLAAGADEVVELVPTAELMNQTPEVFVSHFVNSLSPQLVVEGEGFRFGKNREGTLDELVQLGLKFNFSTIKVPPVEITLQDQSVHRASSSLVRTLIKSGRVEDAHIVLGRSISVSGIVEQGEQRGRTLNFPTANINQIQTLLPADGIYAGRGTLKDGTSFPAAISIGTKPTFGENDRTCEAHLIGLEDDLCKYGWKLELSFDYWLRDQIRFDSIEELKKAIQGDVEKTTQLLERNT